MFRVLPVAAITVMLWGFAAPAPAQDAKMKFELYKGKDDQFRWRLKAGNGRQIAKADEGYKTKAACLRTVELIMNEAASATIEDAP